ncbi:MAG TPA: hypothetical protein VGV09_12920 [Steroidobacteraceae bacterium]|nr:hypothetical protein [Steroidobacteraceae bacterium]
MAGLWETETSVALISGELDTAAASLPSAPPGAPPALARELAERVKLWGNPPYNAEWQARLRNAPRSAAPSAAAQFFKTCAPEGFPYAMESPFPEGLFQAVVTPAETLLLFAHGEVRQIFTDGRKHPASKDRWPTPLGDSIGRWAGATLLIDTIARKAGPVAALPIPGIADLSEQAHFTERVRLIDADTLQDEMIIDDPQRFSHPWQISIRYRRVTDVDRLIPVECTENDRDQVVNGALTIVAP